MNRPISGGKSAESVLTGLLINLLLRSINLYRPDNAPVKPTLSINDRRLNKEALSMKPLAARRSNGFTLIELMIVVAIIGILTAIAYPSYQSHIKRSTEQLARAWLSEIATAQSKYFVNMKGYGSLSDIGKATAPSEIGDYYTIALVEDKDCAGADSAPGYCVAATPKSGGRQSGMATLELDHKGNKLPASAWSD